MDKSFEDSFSRSLSQIFSKYENIDEEQDDELDLFTMDIVNDRGKTRKQKPAHIGTLFEKFIKRKREANIVKVAYPRNFQKIYSEVFADNFYEIYFLIKDDI